MKKLIIVFLLLLFHIMGKADVVKINGIWFNIIAKANIAEVTHGDWSTDYYNSKDDRYSGTIEIPSVITYNEKECNVTSIGKSAFEECEKLISVSIPNSVTKIGGSAFACCKSLKTISIPNSVESIDYGAFSHCDGLIEIYLPDGLTTINHSTFGYCSSLTFINLPKNLKELDNWAFENCSGLKTIFIPDKVTTIGGAVFKNCTNIKTVTLGRSINRIFSYVFENCPNLEEVICYAETPPNTNNNAFVDSYIEYCTLYVPIGSVEKYKTKSPWNQFGKILEITNTSINSITTDSNVKAPIYDLNGRRIITPKKGINIIKGKKVIIK